MPYVNEFTGLCQRFSVAMSTIYTPYVKKKPHLS